MTYTSRRQRRLVIMLMLVVNSSSMAVEVDGVDAAEEALRRTRQPWYDADADAVRQIERDTVTASPTRGDWQSKARPRWDFNWNFPDLSFLGEVLRILGWITLISLIAVLVYILARTFMNVESVGAGPAAAIRKEDLEQERIRIENLPVDVQAARGDFLELARRCYEDGDFGEAITYLFSHQLLQLDRAGQIRLTKGKTNRQYLGEVRHAKDLQKILGQTMVAFEEVFFGKHTLSKERFEGCWNRNDQFNSLVKQAVQ